MTGVTNVDSVRPSLLHKGGPCTRSEKEPPELILKIWRDFLTRGKVVVTMAKAELRKEQEEGLLLDGLKKLMVQISGQNMDNMTKLVDSLKVKKEETAAKVRLA